MSEFLSRRVRHLRLPERNDYKRHHAPVDQQVDAAQAAFDTVIFDIGANDAVSLAGPRQVPRA